MAILERRESGFEPAGLFTYSFSRCIKYVPICTLDSKTWHFVLTIRDTSSSTAA